MAPRNDNPKPRKPGWIAWGFGLPFRILGVVALSILTSIALEWVGIYCEWWAQPGAAHAQATLSSEVGWIDTQFTRSLLVLKPVAIARTVIGGAYHAVFVSTGLGTWIADNASGEGGWAAVATYLQAALDVALVVLVRVVILLLTLPLFVMAGLVGSVDGLVRRDLRRFGAGQESAFIYHHAKRMVGPVFITGWLIYLSIPFSVHPNTFLVPCAALFGLLLSIAVGSFKKYL